MAQWRNKMPDKKKTIKPKKVVKSKKDKHDEWVVDKLTEVVSILEEHDRTLKRIKTRMGL
tara:strand:+ start:11 stop:190 length:180 start_codon:yes stop_codon:yes gene_type:complete